MREQKPQPDKSSQKTWAGMPVRFRIRLRQGGRADMQRFRCVDLSIAGRRGHGSHQMYCGSTRPFVRDDER
jgi:hypothetical protein